MNALLLEKGISKADVVRGSQLDRSYAYQIFSGDKKPSRDKLIALAFGLGLTDEETQKMLKLSGNRELYARDERDAMILFFLQQNRTIFEVNDLLYAHNLTILSDPV
ncbi:MAG: helix-turn-helix transcriptional regulator [Acetatifactor sp.]|nr:helix-turn-helix transcriptional regulator [Acetatifactor sp.]